MNAGICPDRDVIATGGSVGYKREATEHLKSIGTVVYLKLPFESLEKRLYNIKDRGVVLKDGQTLFMREGTKSKKRHKIFTGG